MNLTKLLEELKKSIINKDYIFVDRQKNKISRIKYGLTFEDKIKILSCHEDERND